MKFCEYCHKPLNSLVARRTMHYECKIRKHNEAAEVRIFDREKQSLGVFNFIMLVYLVLKDITWSWWFLLIPPAGIIWAWFDVTFIMPAEKDYHQTKTPMWLELFRDVKWIRKKMENNDL